MDVSVTPSCFDQKNREFVFFSRMRNYFIICVHWSTRTLNCTKRTLAWWRQPKSWSLKVRRFLIAFRLVPLIISRSCLIRSTLVANVRKRCIQKNTARHTQSHAQAELSGSDTHLCPMFWMKSRISCMCPMFWMKSRISCVCPMFWMKSRISCVCPMFWMKSRISCVCPMFWMKSRISCVCPMFWMKSRISCVCPMFWMKSRISCVCPMFWMKSRISCVCPMFWMKSRISCVCPMFWMKSRISCVCPMFWMKSRISCVCPMFWNNVQYSVWIMFWMNQCSGLVSVVCFDHIIV